MSNAGQALLTAAGTAVGTYFGYPQLGYAIGNLAGQALFPTQLPDAVGPRLDESPQPPTVVGTPLPLTYGCGEMRGLAIWVGPYTEHENTNQQGGKGGPEQTQRTYTYTRSYAMMFGCRPKGGLLAIRRNGTWVYDVRARREGEAYADFKARMAASEGYLDKIEIYLGDSDQLPSPTIEAIEGVGNVPAYRGRPLIVWIDDDVTAFRTLPPDIVAIWADEVVEAEATETSYSNEVLFPWGSGEYSPATCANEHDYVRTGNEAGTWFPTLESAISDFESLLGFELGSGLLGWSYTMSGGAGDFTQYSGYMSPYFDIVPGEREYLYLHFNTYKPDSGYFATSGDSTIVRQDCNGAAAMGLDAGDGLAWWTGVYADDPTQHKVQADTANATVGLYRFHRRCDNVLQDPIDSAHGETGVTVCWGYGLTSCGGSDDFDDFPYLGYYPDRLITIRRVPRAPDNPCFPRCTPAYPLLAEHADYCVIDGTIVRSASWTKDESTTYKMLSRYTVSSGDVVRYPRNPALPAGHANYADEAFWTAAYNAAVEAGELPAGLAYDATGNGGIDTYPRTQSFGYVLAESFAILIPVAPALADVIGDLCDRSGVSSSELDAGALDADLDYLYIASQSNARTALEQLQAAYLFDLVDSGNMICRHRGGTAVRAYALDDIGAHASDSRAPVPRVNLELTEPAELPALVTIRYIHLDSYATAEQPYGTQAPDQEHTVVFDLAVALSDARAAQLAQIHYTLRHVESESYQLVLPPDQLDVVPGDPITLPLDSDAARARITRSSGNVTGVIAITAVRDEASAYSSDLTGSDTPAIADTVRVRGPTGITLLDLPVIASSDDNAGYRVAARGFLSGWLGAEIQRSRNAGDSWESLALVTAEATQGVVAAPPVDAAPWTWDRTNTLSVTLSDGALATATESAVLSGANLAAYEVRIDGETVGWELIQFANAEQEPDGSWTLSMLLWGRRGTEWAIDQHQVGDRIVLIGTGVKRVSAEAADIGQVLEHRGVSLGTSPDAAQIVEFAPAGTALKPFAPTYIRAENLDDGTTLVRWERRSRTFSDVWRDAFPPALGEESELYDYELRSESGLTIDAGRVSVPQFTFRAFSEQASIPAAVREAQPYAGVVVGLYMEWPAPAVTPSFQVLDEITLERVGLCAIHADAEYATAWLRIGSDWYVTCTGGGFGGDGLFKAAHSAVLANAPGSIDHYATGIGDAQGLCFDGTDLWISEFYGKRLRRLDTSLTSLQVISTASLTDGGPSGMATDGAVLYVVLRGTATTLAAIQIADASVLWNTECQRFGTAVVLAGGRAFVHGVDELTVVDLATGGVVGAIPSWTTSAPDGVDDTLPVPGLRLRVEDGHVVVAYRRNDRRGQVAIDPASLEIVTEWFWEDQPYAGTFGHLLLMGNRIVRAGSDFSNQLTVWQISAEIGRGYAAEGSV